MLSLYSFRRFFWTCLLAGGMMACSETFELNSPYEDIYVVYSVLDPAADTQYVRVSLAFQPESDAIEFAEDHDPSLPGLDLTLIGSDGSWTATYVDSIRKIGDGDFAPWTSAYQFVTTGPQSLQSGERYRLEIRQPDDSTLFLWAETRIPNAPRIISPERYAFEGELCLSAVAVEDSVTVLFRRNDTELHPSSHFEIRWRLGYLDNGVEKSIWTRPSRLFDRNVRCALAGNGNLCYTTGDGAVLRDWQTHLPDGVGGIAPTVLCSRIPIELSRVADLQVTALDSALASYILANDPRWINFNTIRQEYSNIQGSARAVGVVGSVAYDREPFLLTPCAESSLGFSPIPVSNVCQ